MEIFIADIKEISKNCLIMDEYIKRLSNADSNRYNNIKNIQRKKQFLIGRMLIYDNYGQDFSIGCSGRIITKNKFISLAHSNEIVALAISHNHVGIDVEYLNKKRNTQDIAEFMDFTTCDSVVDFYKQFTMYEANYKSLIPSSQVLNSYYIFDNYLLCLAYQYPYEEIFTYATIPFKSKKEIDLRSQAISHK